MSAVRTTPIIAIEGLDGTGKTEVTARVATSLKMRSIAARTLKFEQIDYADTINKLSRKLHPTSRYLLQLSAFNHEISCARPNSDDLVTICDRYIYSIQAYYKAIEPDYQLIAEVPLPHPCPALKILLSCSAVERKKRIQNKSKAISDRKAQTLLEYGDRIQAAYLEMGNWNHIDTTELPPSSVADQVVSLIERTVLKC